MDCSWVAERIVALQDDELSRSEEAIVLEHLEGCEACAMLADALDRVQPRPALIVPPGVQARLEAAVAQGIEQGLELPPEQPPTALQQARRWLRRDRDMSNGALLAYAAILALCVGWGMSNWLVAQQVVEPPQTVVSVQVPVDHYRPASYAIEQGDTDEKEEWR